MLERAQILRVYDGALIGGHRDLHRIRLRLHNVVMPQVIGNVALAGRDHLIIVGIDPDIDRLEAKSDRQRQADQKKYAAIVEQQSLEE